MNLANIVQRAREAVGTGDFDTLVSGYDLNNSAFRVPPRSWDQLDLL